MQAIVSTITVHTYTRVHMEKLTCSELADLFLYHKHIYGISIHQMRMEIYANANNNEDKYKWDYNEAKIDAIIWMIQIYD